MNDGSAGAVEMHLENAVAAFIKQQRSGSATSADSGIALVDPYKTLHPLENDNTIAPPTLPSDNSAVQSTPAHILEIIDHDGVLLSHSTKALPEAYKQINEALLLGIGVIEDATEKIYQAFKADINLHALKEEDIKERVDAKFCLSNEIQHFAEVLLPEVKKNVLELEKNAYKKEAFTTLSEIKKKLETSKAHIAKNLPPTRSKLFKFANYLLDGLGTLITLILVAMAALHLATLSTTVPCALAALICLVVKALAEKTALPEDNKKMYIKQLEEQYEGALNALEKMEEAVNVLEMRAERAKFFEMQKAQADAANAARAANAAMLQNLLHRHTDEIEEKMKEVVLSPSIDKASVRTLAIGLTKRDPNSLTEEEAKNLEKWLHSRISSPESSSVSSFASGSSQKHATPAELTGQA